LFASYAFVCKDTKKSPYSDVYEESFVII